MNKNDSKGKKQQRAAVAYEKPPLKFTSGLMNFAFGVWKCPAATAALVKLCHLGQVLALQGRWSNTRTFCQRLLSSAGAELWPQHSLFIAPDLLSKGQGQRRSSCWIRFPGTVLQERQSSTPHWGLADPLLPHSKRGFFFLPFWRLTGG